MNLLLKILSCTALIAFGFSANAQTYMNKVWIQNTGLPDSILLSASTTLANGNVAVVGNTWVIGNNTDMLITVYNDAGQQVWQQTHDGINGRDYAVSVKSDGNNLYVIGVVQNSSQDLDIALLKYDQYGSLIWAQNWDGGLSLNDIPTAIELDQNGNVIVAGSTFATASNSDYITLKYTSNGSQVWVSKFDYVGLHDAAVAVTIDNSGNPVVTGASQSGTTSWDYTTIAYNASSGVQLANSRVAVPNTGFDQPQAIAKDILGNFYITGTRDSLGSVDMFTIKLNDNLGLVWGRAFDGHGLEDCGKSLGIDSLSNIYVTGYTRKTNGGTDFITVKYDSSGTKQWDRNYQALNGQDTAEAFKIRVAKDGSSYVVGTVFNGLNKDFILLGYDANGILLWDQAYNGGTSDDIASDILLKDGHVYVTGLSQTISGTTYATVDYATYENNNPQHLDTNSVPDYREHELIIKFIPSMVKKGFVNDVEREFGYLEDVVGDSVIVNMSSKVGVDLKEYRPTVMKIYRELTEADSFSITRLGDTIHMPAFWSTFLVSFPTTLSITSVSDSLRTLESSIEFATLNIAMQPTGLTNDQLFVQQASLKKPPTSSLDVSINIQPAWDDVSVGDPNIKVGILDDGIYWMHPDFGDGTFQGSKIKGGKNFATYVQSQNDPYPISSHGTASAGVIAALRNNYNAALTNYEGVAGIAGGDMSLSTPNTGVSLYSLSLTYGLSASTFNFSAAAPAIVMGAKRNFTSGYGLHVMNNSYVQRGWSSHTDPVKDAVRFAWENHCVFVAGRGNYNGSDPAYPACFNDFWELNVGASGDDGQIVDRNNGSSEDAYKFYSAYGHDVDLVAPGSPNLVVSTIKPGNPIIGSGCNVTQSNYGCYNGTSAAAPHVSGVAALMLSAHDPAKGGYANKLVTEDIEFLMQKYATRPSNTSYTSTLGWGRLNAGATLEKIDFPVYQVFHSGLPTSSPSYVKTHSDVNMYFPRNSYFPAGNYVADRWEITHTYTNTFASTVQILDIWKTYALASGANSVVPNDGDEHFESWTYSFSGNTASVTMKTYVYLIKPGNQGSKWWPTHYLSAKTGYSLHLYDPTKAVVKPITKYASLTAFPIPTASEAIIRYAGKSISNPSIRITNVTGTVVAIENMDGTFESFDRSIQIASWPSGIYFVNMASSNGLSMACKIVKR